jgi:hypothetical protein
MAESKPWVVTLSGDRPINELASDIEEVGFVIDQVLEATNIITGSSTDSVADAVRAIPGVADVSAPTPDIDIGRPDSPETW